MSDNLTKQNATQTEATLSDDLNAIRAAIAACKTLGGMASYMRAVDRVADKIEEQQREIERLTKREAYLIRELNACTDIPSGDKDGLV